MKTNEDTGKHAALLAFGHLLKRLRIAADLTQEALAERANVSARSISDLERGSIHRPRRDTAELLADGLRLRESDRDAFIALARGKPLLAAHDVRLDAPPRHTLPHPPNAIVGRLKETAAATALLLDPEVRLVTLTGPGGVGKTRLALEVAFRAAEAFRDGAVLVDLAPVRGPELVLGAIAETLAVIAQPDMPIRQGVVHALRQQHVLLLLDNFEHVAAAAPTISDLLAACPALKVLVTSRESLHIRAEREYPVKPLVLPDLREVSSLAEMAHVPSVDLFVRRAEAANRQFALTESNARTIAEIAIRLDGLPLAIELAATRVKILSPAALLARLEHRLPLLSGGAKDLPARQQAMRATIDWSHGLLSGEEQTLFRRLAVFAGGCTLEAAEYVGGVGFASPPSPPPSPPSLELVMALVDKNLLRLDEDADDEQRFGMLETIREYGLERLAEAGEATAAREAHAVWCLDLAERAVPALSGERQAAWLARLTIEHDNLRAALGWAIAAHNGELAQRLGVALAWFWRLRGHYEEGRRWLDQALLLETVASPTTRARALVEMAHLADQGGDHEQAPALEEALAIFRDAGDTAGVAYALARLGMLLGDLGDHARGSALEEEALALFRLLDDQPNVVKLLISRGLSAWDEGVYDRATTHLEEALALARTLGSWYSVAQSLNNLALVAYEQGDYGRAMTLQADALDQWQGLDNLEGLAHCLENFAMFTVAQEQAERAARLFGAARSLRARIGAPGRPSDITFLEGGYRAASTALGEPIFARAWAEGEAMPLAAALAHALGADRG